MKARILQKKMTSELVVALVLLLCGVLQGAFAAESDEAYRVQPGDVIEVRVWNEEGAAREFTVNADGNIVYPLVGIVSVKGRTLSEIRERVTQELRKIIKDPVVTVSIKSFANTAVTPTKRIFLLGALNKPGPYPWNPGMRVMDAVGAAGGLAATADAARATLTTGDKSAVPVDLQRLFEQGDLSQNRELQPDDVLLVPSRDPNAESITVMVVGQVTRPGAHRLPKEAKISDAMTACGGPAPGAALRKATLTRAGLSAPVDLEAILRRGEFTADLPLRDGDVLHVPEGRTEVTLVGEFQKPGTYLFKEGDTVMEAITLGGGPTPSADLQAGVLKRQGQEIPLDLEALLRRGEMQHNHKLQDGDVILLNAGIRIYAYGALGKPGPIVVRKGATLMDVLFEAGGPAPNADLTKAGVVREAGDKVEVYQINIKTAVEKGGPGRNFQFARGDVLVVPARTRRFSWQGMVSTLYTLSLIGLNPVSILVK